MLKSVRVGRWVGVAVAAAVLASFVYASPASADEFTPENNAPVLSSPAFTMPGAQTEFEPDAGASAEVYAYAVTVEDLDSLNDLTDVTVCLHHSLHEDGLTAGEGDSTCATPDPQNTVELTWDRATDAFSIVNGGGSYWALGTGGDASTGPADLGATSSVITFRFTVSEAMREGTWTATTTAVDSSAGSDTDNTVSDTVAAYSSITTRVSQDFGTVATLTPVTATDAPTVISNGTTAVSLTAGDFTSGVGTFTLKTDEATSVDPDSGEVTYDCNRAGSFTEGTATRVGSGATSLGTATATGTAEGGTAVSNTCRLVHGGGRPVDTYAFTVVNTIANT